MVRIKHRYLLVNILSPEDNSKSFKSGTAIPDFIQFHAPSPDSLTPQLFSHLIRDQVSLLYGDYGLGLISGSLKIMYLSPATSTAIVRVARDHFRLVWAALSFMTHIPNGGKQSRPCVMRVVRVSGTIKKVEEEAIRRARVAILKANSESGIDEIIDMLGSGSGEDNHGNAIMNAHDSDEDGEGMESEGD